MKTFRSLTLRAILSTVVIASMLLSPPDVRATVEGARARVNALVQAMLDEGYNTRDTWERGFLHRREYTVSDSYLYAGNDYVIIASGCESARDVDIAVFDENYNLIARDADSSAIAVAKISPRWSGTFHIKITMYESNDNDGAHYVLTYFYK